LSFAQAAAKTQFDSELEVIRNEARALLAEYQRYASYSSAQAAWGRLYNSVGLDVLPQSIDKYDIKSLSSSMEQTMAEWQSLTFQTSIGPESATKP
jgi:hypothetical protein